MAERKRFTVPFIPNHILTELAVALVVAGGIFMLAGLVPKGIDMPADPLTTPPVIKPEWYLLWAFAILELFPKWLGISLPGALFGLMFIVPWLERNPHQHPKKRLIAVTIFTLTIIALGVFTYIGATVEFGK